jgi:transposase
MAEIVDIKRFANKRRFIGFCGLGSVVEQFRNYKARFKISKRGNSHARRIAFIMAGSVKRNCPYFREYYLKKRNEGKSYTEAVIATSTKLLRSIYALLWGNCCFR